MLVVAPKTEPTNGEIITRTKQKSIMLQSQRKNNCGIEGCRVRKENVNLHLNVQAKHEHLLNHPRGGILLPLPLVVLSYWHPTFRSFARGGPKKGAMNLLLQFFCCRIDQQTDDASCRSSELKL